MLSENTCKEALSGMLPEEIFSSLGLDKTFTALQIFRWIADGSRSFDTMTNISLSDRKSFSENHTLFSTRISDTLRDPDGTVKLQILLEDGSAVETVLLIDDAGRKTACVSCQVGCPMNCAFCQTGHIGYKRNLSAGEIVEQFYHLEDAVERLDNIVFMGMGEPLLNLESIRKSIAILTHPKGRALSRSRITVSTCGLCREIISLADDGPDIRLAVSLTTANQELRTALMPVNKSNPLSDLHEAIRYFIGKSGKRVTLEVALMKEVNTSALHAREIAEFARGLNVHINLIPWNPVPTLPYKSPSSGEVDSFSKMLSLYGLNVTRRTRRGEKIGGACGQLGRSTI